MTKLKLPSSTSILLNGAALLVAVSSIAVVMRGALFENAAPPCSERYSSGTRFSMDRDGEPLDAIGLQARLGNTDWGLVQSASVVQAKQGPSRFALAFDLASVPAVGAGDGRPGAGFAWAPGGLTSKSGACLAYSVFIPEGFGFGKGGRLPGLMGGAADQGRQPGETGFSARYTWGPAGESDVWATLPGWPEGRALPNNRSGFKLPRGKWVSLEQEMVLNAPDKRDGLLRVWMDGALVFQQSDMMFRKRPDEVIGGVLAEAVAGEQPNATRRGSQTILISPFEVRWN